MELTRFGGHIHPEWEEVFNEGKQKAVPEEYQSQPVELARSGRSVASLAREFEPTEVTVHKWIRQADLDEGERSDELTT